MLPGFNHNIRHGDRLFHVQTEDNGVTQARLVTQIFIDGQLVAIERGSYQDVLDAQLDDKVRTERIRARMQEQHKGQMKRLVSGQLDERIRALFPAAPLKGPRVVDPAVGQAAEALPAATSDLALPTPPEPQHPALEPRTSKSDPDVARQSHPDFLIELDEEMRRHAPFAPTEAQLEEGGRFAREASETVSMDLPPKAPLPGVRPATSGARPAAPARPSSARPRPSQPGIPSTPPSATPPVGRPPRAGTSPTVRPAPAQAASPRPAAASSPPAAASSPPGGGRPGAGRALPRRAAFPPAGDTIIDMGLPAALKESLDRRRAQAAGRPETRGRTPQPSLRSPPAGPPPPQTEAPTPVDGRFRPRQAGLQGDPNDTMLEVDAAELHAQIAAQRERLRKQREAAAGGRPADAPEGEPPPRRSAPKDGEPRGNIVVVERSLDDVILGYLSDDET